MAILIFFAFIAGFVTILSPCILPILPIVLSSGLSGGHRRPLGVVTGFIISFLLFTLFLSVIVKATGISADVLRSVSVVIIIIFGASLLLPQFQLFMEKLFTKLSSSISPRASQGTGFFGGFILGLSLGLIWTPCVGPIIASVITLAATSTVTGSAVLITFAYSLGTAIPMFAITYGGRALLQKVPWLLKNTGNIQKVFGILMIVVAVGIFFNLDRKFQAYVLEIFPQYGTGLTALEDNKAVQNQLKNVSEEKTLKDTVNNMVYPDAPDFIPGGDWLNSKPLTMRELRGKVVLVDFWTYTCINCIRTLPYLKSWYEKYSNLGFVIVGVHTPEFEFEKDVDNLKNAIKDYGLKYPVMQDNNYDTWKAYENHYWPAHYLIDKNGKIRYTHFGEGEYDTTEKTIQKLLNETGAKADKKIDNQKYSVESQTPETYLGYERMSGFASQDQIVHDSSSSYSLPKELDQNNFAFGGNWIVEKESAMPQKGAVLEYNFNAKNVYLVMTPEKNSSRVKVYLDGEVVSSSSKGEDVIDGIITVNSNRLYRLINLPSSQKHILKLEFLDGGISVFAFTFG